MNRKTQIFFSAFSITVILIGAMCGFVVVDLSTDRYMPNQFGPMFEISSVSSKGVIFKFMAVEYEIAAEPIHQGIREIAEYRGLIPVAPRVAGAMTSWGMGFAQEKLAAAAN